MHHRIVCLHLVPSVGLFCLALSLPFFLSGSPPCWADAADDRKWSFRFEGLSIGDVLRELSQKTDVEIFTNRPTDKKRLTKTYTNMSLSRIIRDVFKDVSFALVWYYDENGLDGIGVWFFDGGNGEYPGNLRNIQNRTVVNAPNVSAPFGRGSMPEPFEDETDADREDMDADLEPETEIGDESTDWDGRDADTTEDEPSDEDRLAENEEALSLEDRQEEADAF